MNLFQHNSLCSFSSRLAEHCSRSLVGSLLLASAPALPLPRCALGAPGSLTVLPPWRGHCDLSAVCPGLAALYGGQLPVDKCIPCIRI